MELLDLLQEKERRIRESPLNYLQQHEKQYQASTSLCPVRALFWGNRVGKTEWGGQETARYVTPDAPNQVEVIGQGKVSLGTRPLPQRELIHPVEVWIGCPSFDLQKDTTQKKLQMYVPTSAIAHVDYLRGEIWKDVRLTNGDLLTFKSYEQGREKWQGAGKRLIWFDEEPPYDIWEEAFVRQEAGIPLDIILTMTAIKGMTWVYDKIYCATDNPDIFISSAGWDDNPWLEEPQKGQMSRGLSPEAIAVRKHGKFVKRVGLVCPWFTRSVHVRHYDQLDPSWTWFELLDGGFSDPLAYLLMGVDQDDSVHIVKGFREPGLLTDDIEARRHAMVSGLTINCGFCDNDNPRLIQELTQRGMIWIPVDKKTGEAKSWDETLAEKMYEYGAIQKGTGLPRLYISDSLVRFDEKRGETINWLQQELENLAWLEHVNRAGSETRPQWDDHRRFGHHFDGVRALAYGLMSYKNQTPLQVELPDWANNLPSWVQS